MRTAILENLNAEFNRLLDQLQGQRGAAEVDALDALVAFLDENPSGRPQAPFDPNNLPFLNLQPLSDNTPRIQAEQFQADFPDLVAAMNGETLANDQSSATPRGTDPNAFDNPQWLSISDEVVLTDAIMAQAAELDNDPVQIYHWDRFAHDTSVCILDV